MPSGAAPPASNSQRRGRAARPIWRLLIIALVIVAVALAALAALVQSWYADRSRLAELPEVLRDLEREQLAHFGRHRAYASRVGAAPDKRTLQLAAPADVSVRIVRGGRDGWSAIATHAKVKGRMCGMYVGPPPFAPDPAVKTASVPACW